MQNTSILDVNSIAYTYRIDVTAQYGAKPYTAIISYFYISIIVALSARKQFSPISGVKPRTDFIKAIKYLFLIKFLI